MTSDTVDFLMGQKDGANYVVLYQMLCLKTVNNNGELSRMIGEVMIPYDEEKIQRDMKYFSLDTIRVAMGLYKKLGLIYEQENGILTITDFKNMIGSQTISAYKKQIQIENRGGKKVENFPPDKEKDKEIDIDKEKRVVERKESDDTTTLKDFLTEFDISMDNYSERINEMNYDALSKAYRASKWLQTNITSLSRICKEYERIVGGYYKDYTNPNKMENSHGYSKEQLDDLVDNIDDIEF